MDTGEDDEPQAEQQHDDDDEDEGEGRISDATYLRYRFRLDNSRMLVRCTRAILNRTELFPCDVDYFVVLMAPSSSSDLGLSAGRAAESKSAHPTGLSSGGSGGDALSRLRGRVAVQPASSGVLAAKWKWDCMLQFKRTVLQALAVADPSVDDEHRVGLPISTSVADFCEELRLVALSRDQLAQLSWHPAGFFTLWVPLGPDAGSAQEHTPHTRALADDDELAVPAAGARAPCGGERILLVDCAGLVCVC
jgi:hypothetical protein